MKLISQNKQSISVELSPLELELIRSAVTKELDHRRRAWNSCHPKYPEELMYHAIMKDTSESLLFDINGRIRVYKEWGILK